MPLTCLSSIKRVCLVTLAALVLSACASHDNRHYDGPSGPPLPGLPDRVELGGVPFYRGEAFHGAALSLAALLRLQGVSITPGLLEPTLHLPDDIDHLPYAVPNAAREFGMVVYPLDPNLNALLAQVAAGYPVLVRFTEGSMLWSEPRYAVLVGYDRFKRHVVLRAGQDRRRLVTFDSFASDWKNAGSWAVLVQRPNQLPAQLDRARWLQAAKDLAQAGQVQAAAVAVQAAGH